MSLKTLSWCVGMLVMWGLLMTTSAASVGDAMVESLPNSIYVYTGAFQLTDSGVAELPPQYRFAVETSWRGFDTAGQHLPDSRIMLRLHDPELGFSALTAQLDLATAAKLHHELGDMLVRKLQNPYYQDRKHLNGE